MSSLHRSLAALNNDLEWICQAPEDGGSVRLIVCRPAVDQRKVLSEAVVDGDVGLVGDNWAQKGSSSTPDGTSDPRAQITIINWRAIKAVAGSEDRCPLAGDQLYLDLDIGETNLPAGSLLSIGTAILEVSVKTHTGCHKFSGRFGTDALRFVNVGLGRKLRLRGANTTIRQAGVIRLGDPVIVNRPVEPIA